MTTPFHKDLAVAWVLARGGSKGLPGKNIRALGGRPLIAWAIALGRSAREVGRVCCSTDSGEIAQVARHWGAEIPFLRPAQFAADASTDIDVFTHALDWMARTEGALPEFVVHLRPTTPFREAAWVDDAIRTMRADPAITCVRSVALSPLSPFKMWKVAEDNRLAPLMTLDGMKEPFNQPRQKLPAVYWHTGQMDVIRTETLLAGSMTGENIHALFVDAGMAVDIDTPVDFKLAELLFDERMPATLRAIEPA